MNRKKIDGYVETLTQRLKMDPELKLDIARELKSHLEEAVEENKKSGMNEEDGIDTALKHFGPSKELADQLWRANLRRMRLRALINLL